MNINLLLDIARCPVVQHCLANPRIDHPCADIVRVQHSRTYADHQTPEPWSGHLSYAPILFLSSNPSLSDRDVVPTGDWTDDSIIDYFENRFGGGRKEWIKDGTRGLSKDGSHLGATMFWAAVRRRAAELLQRDVTPGIDYALTEIVHCKSRAEQGVRQALDHCKGRYLSRVMKASAARVVVALGSLARQALTAELCVSDNARLRGPVEFFGRERVIACLPHPNARTKRTFPAVMSREELQVIRNHLHR